VAAATQANPALHRGFYIYRVFFPSFFFVRALGALHARLHNASGPPGWVRMCMARRYWSRCESPNTDTLWCVCMVCLYWRIPTPPSSIAATRRRFPRVDVDVADAMKRLWARDGHGRVPDCVFLLGCCLGSWHRHHRSCLLERPHAAARGDKQLHPDS
jgi:hypothetical protein